MRSLIEEKGYEAVSVQDIIERADVARTTFYLHFKDKDSLLFSGLQDMYDSLMDASKAVPPDRFGEHVPLMIPLKFEHAAKFSEFYRMLFSQQGSPAFMSHLREFFAAVFRRDVIDPAIIGTEPRYAPDLIAQQMAGAQIAALLWWLERDMPESPEEIARISYQMTAFGAGWALGIKINPPE